MIETKTDPSVTAELLDAVERIRGVLETNAPVAEAERRLPEAAFEAMSEAGLFGMLAPRDHGGLELPITETMRVWEAVTRIDSAAGWNLVMNQGFGCTAAWLPEEGVRELFEDGPPTMAGPFFPPGSARRVNGGWQVTAGGSFVSGCHNVPWLWVPALETKDGEPVLDPESEQPIAYGFILPRDEAEILDTWHTLGMRGTGSADIRIAEAFVPDRLTMRIGPLETPAPGFEGPLYRMWPLCAVLGETTVSVGVAATAVDSVRELVQTKTPNFATTALHDQPLPQHAVGRAAARVNASRDTLHAAAGAAYDELEASGEGLSGDAKLRLQLAITYAAEACAEAVRLVHDVAGSSGIRLEQPFERHFRDAHTLTQHASKNSARYVTCGRLLFGLENDWTALDF